MGIYYYFFNEETGEQSKVSIEYSTLNFVAKFDSLTTEHQLEIFHDVVAKNGWTLQDEIIAYPDCPGCLRFSFQNGEITVLYADEDEQQELSDDEDIGPERPPIDADLIPESMRIYAPSVAVWQEAVPTIHHGHQPLTVDGFFSLDVI